MAERHFLYLIDFIGQQYFNLKFGSIYDKLDAIFMRKPFNLTKTLDALKNAINKEARKRANKH